MADRRYSMPPIWIESRERVCLVGRNGEGKTTLLRVLNDEAKLDSGSAFVGRA